MATKHKTELLATSIYMGVIDVIGERGNIVSYRQKGIGKLSKSKLAVAIAQGLLHPNIMSYPELPSQYTIAFESEEIAGRADDTFRMPVQ